MADLFACGNFHRHTISFMAHFEKKRDGIFVNNPRGLVCSFPLSSRCVATTGDIGSVRQASLGVDNDWLTGSFGNMAKIHDGGHINEMLG